MEQHLEALGVEAAGDGVDGVEVSIVLSEGGGRFEPRLLK